MAFQRVSADEVTTPVTIVSEFQNGEKVTKKLYIPRMHQAETLDNIWKKNAELKRLTATAKNGKVIYDKTREVSDEKK